VTQALGHEAQFILTEEEERQRHRAGMRLLTETDEKESGLWKLSSRLPGVWRWRCTFSVWLVGLATDSGAVAFPQKPFLSETIFQNLLDCYLDFIYSPLLIKCFTSFRLQYSQAGYRQSYWKRRGWSK